MFLKVSDLSTLTKWKSCTKWKFGAFVITSITMKLFEIVPNSKFFVEARFREVYAKRVIPLHEYSGIFH